MPKLKTHSGTKKRLAVTKKGKIVHRHAMGNHFLQKKRASRRRLFAGTQSLSSKKQVKNVLRKLGA